MNRGCGEKLKSYMCLAFVHVHFIELTNSMATGINIEEVFFGLAKKILHG
jgi:hypothetical protein